MSRAFVGVVALLIVATCIAAFGALSRAIAGQFELVHGARN